MSANSFERFYYEKVALSEGCGCAEQIIMVRDIEARSRQAAPASPSDPNAVGLLARIARIFRRKG